VRRPLTAADAAVAAAFGFLGAVDVHRHRHGLDLVTDSLRRPVVTGFLVVLMLHVVDVLGAFDPFRLAGRLIPRSHHAHPLP
jgi:hypothetical protein